MKTKLKPPPEKNADQRAERRSKILAAAAKLFAAHGYSACDMERIAAKLKIAKGTIYLYFQSKEELFRACIAEAMTQMQAEVRAASESEPEPLQQLTLAIRAYLDFFANHPEYVELFVQERAVLKNRQRPTYFEHRDAGRVYWRRFYQRLIDDGRLRPDFKVESILNTIGNLCFGTMFANHFLGTPRDSEAQCQEMLDIVLKGLLSDEERAKD